MSLFQELFYENSTNEEAYPVSIEFGTSNYNMGITVLVKNYSDFS